MDHVPQPLPPALDSLNGQPLGAYTLLITRCEPMARRSGWRRLAVTLADGGTLAEWDVIKGFYSVAGPGRGSWLDCDVYPAQSIGGRDRDLAEDGLTVELFRLVGDTITSHCMVSYEVWEHSTELHTITEQSYRLGIPPAATPVGELLVAAGCIAGFKDWYIAEGGNEGPRKLQAEKPPTAAARTESLSAMARALIAYLARRPVAGAEAVEGDCRRRAVRLLEKTGPWPEELRPMVGAVVQASLEADDMLLDCSERVRRALKARTPPWSLEDGP